MENMSTIEEVEKVINKLRPYLNRDGGDIELVDFKDGIVYVKMLGACAGCAMLDETLKKEKKKHHVWQTHMIGHMIRFMTKINC